MGLGVHDVTFHKKRGLSIDTTVKSREVYRQLRNFQSFIGVQHIVHEAGGALHTARAGSKGVRLVIGRRLQPRSSWTHTR
jgi:hypothetical protein